MTVVIQELVVRVVVESRPGAAPPSRQNGPGADPPADDRAALIEAAVQETLRILRQQEER
jgi:hypothetical protein